MSKKNNGVNYSMKVPVRNRRVVVLRNLESSLAAGTKKDKSGKVVPLTDTNVKRIDKELATLKNRI